MDRISQYTAKIRQTVDNYFQRGDTPGILQLCGKSGMGKSTVARHCVIEDNVIYVGEGHHHPGLLRKALKISADEVHWIREDMAMKSGESREYKVRIRYRQPLQDAVLYQRNKYLYIVFKEHQRGISAGQFAVWYDENGEMLGSGVIDL